MNAKDYFLDDNAYSRDKFWIIIKMHKKPTDTLKPDHHPTKLHRSFESADEEAQRLALLYPHNRFIICEAKQWYKASAVMTGGI